MLGYAPKYLILFKKKSHIFKHCYCAFQVLSLTPSGNSHSTVRTRLEVLMMPPFILDMKLFQELNTTKTLSNKSLSLGKGSQMLFQNPGPHYSSSQGLITIVMYMQHVCVHA